MAWIACASDKQLINLRYSRFLKMECCGDGWAIYSGDVQHSSAGDVLLARVETQEEAAAALVRLGKWLNKGGSECLTQ